MELSNTDEGTESYDESNKDGKNEYSNDKDQTSYIDKGVNPSDRTKGPIISKVLTYLYWDITREYLDT